MNAMLETLQVEASEATARQLAHAQAVPAMHSPRPMNQRRSRFGQYEVRYAPFAGDWGDEPKPFVDPTPYGLWDHDNDDWFDWFSSRSEAVKAAREQASRK